LIAGRQGFGGCQIVAVRWVAGFVIGGGRLVPAAGPGTRFGGVPISVGGRILPLEQRILLQLAFDVVAELQVRQLKQLDRLLQLLRHLQRLALPEL
jgi:hypothetical protein